MEFFALLFFVLFAYFLLMSINIFLKGIRLRRNPNNENITKFTRFARRLYIMPDSPNTWGSLRKTYNTISENKNIDLALRIQLFEVLKKRGVHGMYYPQGNKPMDLEQKLDEVQKLLEKGKITEQEYQTRRSNLLNS